jgi:hypothetical protein
MKWIYLTRLALFALSFIITLFVGFILVINSYTQIPVILFLSFEIWIVGIGVSYFFFVIIISRNLGIAQDPIALSEIFNEINKNKSKNNQQNLN